MDIAIQKGAQLVVVKQGAKGCRIKTAEHDITVASFPAKAITTVGAGDCFNMGFISQLLAGQPLEACARYGNACASIKVSQNKWPEGHEVEAVLNQA